MENNVMEELKKLSAPLSAFLIEHFDLHATIVITANETKVVQDTCGVVFSRED